MNIQAPPNLNPGALHRLIDAGINDWGGVSPVTPDHVNPEAPWPHLKLLERATNAAGKQLVERLAIYPEFARRADVWVDPALRTSLLRRIDADGWPRTDEWSPGTRVALPDRGAPWTDRPAIAGEIPAILARAQAGRTLGETDIVRLFRARGDEFAAVCKAADELRQATNGDVISYVVTRNINYTNICYFKCQFCAFSKGKMSENLRGRPYDLSLAEIERRVREAWARGATEVCMQGGIHPSYTGARYLDICRAVKGAAPGIHIHAFSPLEVHQGAATLGVPVEDFLRSLQATGLDTLPGTAAEILDDEVRAVLCPDKIRTGQWLQVMRAAHRAGLRSTATIMFGHVDRYEHWARHILRIRELQEETGGFTEFVPLPFVHMEAPIYLKGRSRRGPTFREAVLMHAIGRLALHPLVTNIQTSWVKMGHEGVKACLRSGANDLGGTLMDETITRSAGASHGQEMTPMQMENTIRLLGRTPRQRDTLYDTAPEDRYRASFAATRPRHHAGGLSADVQRCGSPGGCNRSRSRIGDMTSPFLIRPEILDGNRRRAAVECLRAAQVTLPTWSELADPALIPAAIGSSLKSVGPDEPNGKNLWRVHWFNDADRRGRAPAAGPRGPAGGADRRKGADRRPARPALPHDRRAQGARRLCAVWCRDW